MKKILMNVLMIFKLQEEEEQEHPELKKLLNILKENLKELV